MIDSTNVAGMVGKRSEIVTYGLVIMMYHRIREATNNSFGNVCDCQLLELALSDGLTFVLGLRRLGPLGD